MLWLMLYGLVADSTARTCTWVAWIHQGKLTCLVGARGRRVCLQTSYNEVGIRMYLWNSKILFNDLSLHVSRRRRAPSYIVHKHNYIHLDYLTAVPMKTVYNNMYHHTPLLAKERNNHNDTTCPTFVSNKFGRGTIKKQWRIDSTCKLW